MRNELAERFTQCILPFFKSCSEEFCAETCFNLESLQLLKLVV